MKMKIFIKFVLVILPFWCCSAFCNADNPAKKLIALSFDDGPHVKYTEEVLHILKENNIKATFFVIGGCVRNHADLLKETFADGNVIGNHTFTHPNLSKLSNIAIEKEAIKANDIIYKTIGVRPALLRPPYGACNDNCKQTLKKLGFTKVTWHYLVNDWDINKTSSEIIASSIIKNASPGAIMAMHDGSGNREKTVQALPRIISTLKQQGYQFVTVPELLKVKAYMN